ncbi:sulfatase-like hydrolase/transferase [Xinfangfangia sp. D13-10-4-6]|uniref:sulfatase-like hydrolase/transferase n=1 Tax=Pseudogemmobacter hezensis TaxID=2737662 RepID=UPI0015580E2E|nr:sulfatase-like hydrolase/transferase [Pseudogemmobacter hezensis]NPD14337.1 sulfatase-like hydrolase/transferase [Pseudogemmobacter hezensis]
MSKKNILLVSFDDACAPWRYKTAFQEPLQLPTLEALCRQATVFQSAYCQAPICGPSRASMMTSQLPSDLGILDNSTFLFDHVPAETSWIHTLRESGYFCSSGGKVHHKPTLARPHHRALYSDERKAFDVDMRLPRELRRRSHPFGGHRHGRGTVDGVDDDFFFDQQVANSTIDFLETYRDDRPFFREVGFFSPHGPHITPARFKRAYNAANFVKPAEWDGYIADSPYVSRNIPEFEEFRSLDFWQKSVRNYFSAYSHGDYQLGRVLSALLSSAHAENTIVAVVSDHGFHLGSRNLFRKTTLWEQSLHVPFVIFDPSDPQGQIVTDPVALLDLGPTLMDFAEVTSPPPNAGRSLRPMMHGARDPDRVIPSYYGNSISIRKGDYRIIRYASDPASPDFQLFDLRNDYWQLNNLGTGHPAFAPMRQALDDWARQTGYVYRDQGQSDAAPDEGGAE